MLVWQALLIMLGVAMTIVAIASGLIFTKYNKKQEEHNNGK